MSALAVLLTAGVAVSGAVDLAAAQARRPAAKPASVEDAVSHVNHHPDQHREARHDEEQCRQGERQQDQFETQLGRCGAPRASPPRSGRAGRAVAARKAREAREVAQPLYKLDASGAIVPDVRAAAAIIYNPVTHEILWEANGEQERSIASITKVMTAVVFLEHEYDLEREVIVDPIDVRGASTTFLRGKERLRLGDLLHLMLIASDNAAARTLARQSIHGPEGFVGRMNEKAANSG
jgi:hypothetical protein